ncbi:MAG: chromosomal replication initiator protein DnaA [Gammaproteobacteria bacterium]|nr:chromosomal replication initiator protein DnaA [Gammaproteobacteria bacterium]MBT3869257.1 chromosomal replication initiator protein DnaA [Gammaproteobacteria bacterium]MBT4616630.1 chromosomal replication initiator protein DnaA [Gammaproteobacteria bacterium]MBT5196742.1 chromosomal replication initiator protein DnaA [Gammaproteobacteria bacterium]MBT5790602.1 chromosomal replication initiator protein DnaA [Gammaproteobacteria bacterium]
MGAKTWQKCLDKLEDELSSQQFNTWIRPLQAVGDDDNVKLLAPNRYIKDQVNTQFLDRIRELLSENGSGSVALEIGSSGRLVEGKSEASNTFAARERFYPLLDLNKAFTFDTFVEGRSNQIARAAALQVSENIGGSSYNPLLLYGGVGLGKTHLMHAVGNSIADRHPNLKVAYMYSQRFMEDMVRAIEHGTMGDFTQYYRSVDVLLMDDIQFLAKGMKTQEEFFHVFNRLQEDGSQIVLTCDRYPKEIEGLEPRLESRFVWGMTAPVEPPDLETRVAILLKKAEIDQVHLPSESAFFIAERIRSNVRELEGALKRVIANSNFTGEAISNEQIRESLRDLLAIQDRQIGVDNIQKTVADYYKIRLGDLHSKTRTRSIARPRQVAMALAKELTNHSLPEIGNAFGGRDHTTVLHACRKIEELKESNRDIREDYNNLLRLLTS